MKRIIGILLLSILAFLPLAYADGAEQLNYDQYKIENAIIKFSPPAGWALRQGPVPSIHLTFYPRSADLTPASLGIVACSAPFGSGFDMEKLMKATDKDKSILSREIVDFDNTKAFSSVSDLGGLKTWTIQFLKDGNMFTITFAADTKIFDALLPSIEESLKTFDVVSPAPQERTISSDQAYIPAQAVVEMPVQPQAAVPAAPIAEPFQEKGEVGSVAMIRLKSGSIVKGKVLEKSAEYLKVDFHGVPISVYFSDIDTIDD